jgi:hypothetical protein
MYAAQPGPVNKQGLTSVFVRVSDTCTQSPTGVYAAAGGGGGSVVLFEVEAQNGAPLDVDPRLPRASVTTDLAGTDSDGNPVTVHLVATWTETGPLEHTSRGVLPLLRLPRLSVVAAARRGLSVVEDMFDSWPQTHRRSSSSGAGSPTSRRDSAPRVAWLSRRSGKGSRGVCRPRRASPSRRPVRPGRLGRVGGAEPGHGVWRPRHDRPHSRRGRGPGCRRRRWSRSTCSISGGSTRPATSR